MIKKLKKILFGSKIQDQANTIDRDYVINSEAVSAHYNWPLDFAIHTAVPNGLKGDYWEFGVYQGRSFIRAYNTFRKLNSLNRNFVAFDSFQGLPESNEPFKPQQYAAGSFSYPENDFINNLRKAQVDVNKVITIAGFYDESLNRNDTSEKLKNSKIAVVYIDCDIYESAKDVFSFVGDYLQDGSIIVMDDWFRHLGIPSYGIQRAFYEWINNSDWKYVELAKSKKIAFIVYK